MDTATLEQRAEDISSQYLDNLPPDRINGRFSGIAEPDTLVTLLKAFRSGLNIKDSCTASGITERTYQNWQNKADADPEGAHGVLFSTLKAERANGKLWHLENIKKHAEKLWVPSAWILERTDPEQFALRKDTDNSPRVVVQIGVSQGDVQVSVTGAEQGTLSPPSTALLSERSQNP